MAWKELTSIIKGLIIGIIFIIITYSAYTYVYTINRWGTFSFIAKPLAFLFLLPMLPILFVVEGIFRTTLFGMTFMSSQHNWFVDIFLIIFWLALFTIIGSKIKSKKQNQESIDNK